MKQSETLQCEQDPFSNNAQGIGLNMHGACVLMNFLPSKPQVKSMKTTYFDLLYTISLNLSDDRRKNFGLR